jgi:hypothetical protein
MSIIYAHPRLFGFMLRFYGVPQAAVRRPDGPVIIKQNICFPCFYCGKTIFMLSMIFVICSPYCFRTSWGWYTDPTMYTVSFCMYK